MSREGPGVSGMRPNCINGRRAHRARVMGARELTHRRLRAGWSLDECILVGLVHVACTECLQTLDDSERDDAHFAAALRGEV